MVPTVLAGENKIWTRTAEIRGEQQLRVGYDDLVGVGGIGMDYGCCRASVTSLPGERRCHSPAPLRA